MSNWIKLNKGFDPREPKGAWWRRQLIGTTLLVPFAVASGLASIPVAQDTDVATGDAIPAQQIASAQQPSALQTLKRNAQGMMANIIQARSAHASTKDASAMEHLAFAALDEVATPTDMALNTIRLAKGETVSDLLSVLGLTADERANAIRALSRVVNVRTLKSGQNLTISLDPDAADSAFKGLKFKVDVDRSVAIERDENGKFTGKEIEIPLERRVVRVDGRVLKSLYKSMRENGASRQAIARFTKAFAFDVDMQRDVTASDEYTVLYETFLDEDGIPVRTGDVIYAALTAKGNPHEFYRYKTNGRSDFYNAEGENGRQFLMRTPVDGARLSSGFGRRKHPVLGYSKMHKGTDFAAPRGTPIMASGDGVVEKVKWGRGYGKYIKLKHGKGYETVYAHMSRFAKGLKPGSRVQQGQVIGYIGSTGMSTGNHLHYEVIYKGRHINPMSAKVPTGVQLTGSAKKKFEAKKTEVQRLLAVAPSADKITEIVLAEREKNQGSTGKPDTGFAQASK